MDNETPSTPPSAVTGKFLRKVRRNDRIAKSIIHLVGMGVILVVILIIFIIGSISLPLFKPVSSEERGNFALPKEASANPQAIGIDEYLETAYAITPEGDFVFFYAADQKPAQAGETPKHNAGQYIDTLEGGDKPLKRVQWAGQDRYHFMWQDGSAATMKVKFRPVYDTNQVRTITHQLETQQSWPAKAGISHTLSAGDGETKIRLDQKDGGGIDIVKATESEDFLGNVTKSETKGSITDIPAFDHLILSMNGRTMYGAKDNRLFRYDLRNLDDIKQLDDVEHSTEITSIAYVNGEVSVAVGDADGGITTYMPVEIEPGKPRELQRIHDLRNHDGPVNRVFTAARNKTILSLGEDGIHADYMTSERKLATFRGEGIQKASLGLRGDGVIALLGDGSVRTWSFDAPHPEVSMKTLFGKVHYENYAEPKHEWQSSSSDTTHEPKLGLIPLINGTLKATLFAMLFALPIAVLAALYSSQFMSPKWRNVVKPTVEIMAAVPSVVVGFLAAYWLAPILYNNMVPLFLSILTIPLTIGLAVFLWRKFGPRLASGTEFALVIPVVVVAVALAWGFGQLVEGQFMATEYYPAGNFSQWISDTFGKTHDQRNAILISFALGFAVMPIIFTLADDALSSVPRGLTAASLALGADRWQTAWKVVLPSASPGIFAATMIGLGRAVGETMIVLMAAGGVAVLGFDPFNGMRTMSANIATEMPEAAINSTHYRVLFLSAVILFIMTFVLNTVAEIVRSRLRKKYGNY